MAGPKGLQGRMIIWCEGCGKYYAKEETAPTICPRCGVRSTRMRCYRCGHEWLLRSQRLPGTCANKACKSKYWNRTRVLKERMQ